MGEEIKQEDLLPRIGTFLMLLGLFAFILFLASDFSNQTDFDWLFGGLVLMAAGWFITWAAKASAVPPGTYGCHAGSMNPRCRGILRICITKNRPRGGMR